MLDAIRFLGAKVDMDKEVLVIEGVAGKLHAAEDVIQCGNSGQVLRFIGALAALSPNYTVLTGDMSIRHNRPVLPLLDGLTQLGALEIPRKVYHAQPEAALEVDGDFFALGPRASGAQALQAMTQAS